MLRQLTSQEMGGREGWRGGWAVPQNMGREPVSSHQSQRGTTFSYGTAVIGRWPGQGWKVHGGRVQAWVWCWMHWFLPEKSQPNVMVFSGPSSQAMAVRTLLWDMSLSQTANTLQWLCCRFHPRSKAVEKELGGSRTAQCYIYAPLPAWEGGGAHVQSGGHCWLRSPIPGAEGAAAWQWSIHRDITQRRTVNFSEIKLGFSFSYLPISSFGLLAT